MSRTKQKSYVTWSESDTEEKDGDEEEILNNFVAYLGIIEDDKEGFDYRWTDHDYDRRSDSEE